MQTVSERGPGGSRAPAAARGAILVLLALALAARVALVLTMAGAAASRFPASREHLAIGRGLAAGLGYRLPETVLGRTYAARYPPAYPALVAAAHAASDDALHVLLLVQAVAGTATVALAAWMAWRLAGLWAAMVAVVLLAFDTYQVYFAALALPDVVAGLLLALALAVGLAFVRAVGRGRGRGALVWAAAAGLALAGAACTDARLLAVVPVAGVAALLGRPRRRWLAGWGLGTAVVLAALAPWLIRNQFRLGAPVLTTAAGEALYEAQRPLDPAFEATLAEAATREGALAAHREALAHKTAALGEVQRDAWYAARAARLAADRPGRAAALAAERVGRVWSPAPNFRRVRTPLHGFAGWMSLLPTAALALLGAVVLRRQGAVVLWLLVPAVAVTLLSLAVPASCRDRLVAMPALAALGGAGLAGLGRRPRGPADDGAPVEAAGSAREGP